MRPLRLILSLYLEASLSAYLILLPLANGDLGAEIGLHLFGAHAIPVLIWFVGGIGGTAPLAIWARPVAKAFRGWR